MRITLKSKTIKLGPFEFTINLEGKKRREFRGMFDSAEELNCSQCAKLAHKCEC